ncbi:single-stranded-DNA-specific exonuclease RecJ [Patescibacteria group bacterium]|nr:single-stranded-DNA-specific exonuclease RecJ [Patescibacteria group bacterium]MBU1868737.1 single-stranded-DNA-specific exonuclease RecJ [Patescibacteria group bacterium]
MPWELINHAPTANLSPEEIVRLLLINRKIDPASNEDFLNPKIDLIGIYELPAPGELIKAQRLINRAIKQKRPIIIHGDYDVDGLCATTILWETIYRHLNYQLTRPFIPHRTKHGYGISKQSLDEVRQIGRQLSSKPPLLITVDCGISAKEELEEYNKQTGAEIILTDHHLLPSQLPRTDSLLHTTELSGTGVAWLLASRLLNSSHQNPELFLDLVALATIGDLVPLTSHNRSLVARGLALLTQTPRPGLQELYKLAKLSGKTINPYHVGWIIAPRLNAPGRLSHALESLKLLATRDYQQSRSLALSLERQNRERQTLTTKAVEEAEVLAKLSKEKVLVLSSPQWIEGIIGLIASKIAEKLSLPTFVIAERETLSKGSARASKNFDLANFLNQHKDLLINFGGHAQAAGFTILTSNIQLFTSRTQETAQKMHFLDNKQPALAIDLELHPSKISADFYRIIKRLEPHGIGNPAPLFLSRQLRASRIHTVGKNSQHLKMEFHSPQIKYPVSGIGFNLAHLHHSIREGELIDVVYQLTENDYYGDPKIEFIVKDLTS